MKKYLILAVFALVLISSIYVLKDETVAGIIMIDINPSVKISIDDENIVIDVKALNEEAKLLDFTGLKGKPVDEAISEIVTLATAAGFINLEDLEEDYVLITTVPMKDKNEKQMTLLGARLKADVGEDLSGMNVAIIKATKVEMLKAEGKKVPVGLYIVNGEITKDGETMSVKDYFSHQQNVEKFKEKGTIIEKSKENRQKNIQKTIDRLSAQGYEMKGFSQQLLDEGADLKVLAADMRSYMKDLPKGNSKGDEKDNGNKGKSENAGGQSTNSEGDSTNSGGDSTNSGGDSKSSGGKSK